MLATWSVRTYNIILRNKLEVETPAQAIAAGDLVMENKIKNAGLKCAIEFYRGAGLGVYQIAEKIHYCKSLDMIIRQCNDLDRYTFHYDLRS